MICSKITVADVHNANDAEMHSARFDGGIVNCESKHFCICESFLFLCDLGPTSQQYGSIGTLIVRF